MFIPLDQITEKNYSGKNKTMVNTKYTFVIFLLIISQSIIKAKDILNVNFENKPFGTYTVLMSQEDFNASFNVNSEKRAEIISDNIEHGKVLQLHYPKNCLGTKGDNSCAIQFKYKNPEYSNHLTLSYDVFFESNFDFRKGGKLPGFCGGKCYTGGNKPLKADGWSARIMWKKNGFLTQYIYTSQQKGKYADNHKWIDPDTKKQSQITSNQWHNIKTEIVLNTVDKDSISKNGQLRTWFDGKLVLELDNLLFRNSDTQYIDFFYFSTFHGGNDDSFSPIVDSFIRFDNLRIYQ